MPGQGPRRASVGPSIDHHLLSFGESFTINSLVAHVTGTKSLANPLPPGFENDISTGICVDAFGEEISQIQAISSYDATITDTTGMESAAHQIQEPIASAWRVSREGEPIAAVDVHENGGRVVVSATVGGTARPYRFDPEARPFLLVCFQSTSGRITTRELSKWKSLQVSLV